MLNYDKIFSEFGNLPAEEKLAVLRSETRTLLTSARGFAKIILTLVEERKPQDLPDDIEKWCSIVVEQLDQLQDVIEGLTDQQHRDGSQQELQEQIAQEDQERNNYWWLRLQYELPELQQYRSFIEAVDQTAQQLGIELTELPGQIRKEIDLSKPDAPVKFSNSTRRVSISYQVKGAVKRESIWYLIKLEWLIDERNQDWQEYASLTKSLEKGIVVLHRWMFEEWKLDKIQEEYPWMRAQIVHSPPKPRWLPEGWVSKGSGISPVDQAESHFDRADGGIGQLRIWASQGPLDSFMGLHQEVENLEIQGQPAIYSASRYHEDGVPESSKLKWAKFGITYTIDHYGFRLSREDIVRIAESL
jgi:hypothetical protein